MNEFMVATVILGMLCVHLLCFCVMFMLISRRLHGKKMGMEVFALGNLLLGCAYIAVRWVEAWGLWHDKIWGEWFGALTSGIYIPLEIRHIMIARHWQGVAVLVLNIALMLVLFWRIYDRKREAANAEQPATPSLNRT